MELTLPPLLSPANGARLVTATPGQRVGGVIVPDSLPDDSALLSDGQRLWPVLAGIPYLRPREDMRAAAVAHLAADRADAALRLLLTDQDRFAPTPPPDSAALDRLLADDPARGGAGELNLREAMALLSYGPVGDYFAYRWCSPTYLSGLVLLARAARAGEPVVEVACGIGHYLAALAGLGQPAIGVDIVFSKLYLARKFLQVRGPLICGDVEAGPVLAPAPPPRTVFCHDAFYFFEHKAAALDHFRALAGPDGTVAVGHVHSRGDAHEAGFAESVAAYAARLPDGVTLVDDADLPLAWYGQAGYPEAAADPTATAVAWSEGARAGQALDWFAPVRASGHGLRQNPLLSPAGVTWPSEGWRREYEADAAKLGPYHLQALGAEGGIPEAATLSPAEREDAYRRRLLVRLPARW